MNLKMIFIQIILLGVISNCSEPERQKPILDVSGLENYLSSKGDFKAFISISANNYMILSRTTPDERIQAVHQINSLLEQKKATEVETFITSKGIVLDENRYLQNVVSDLTSRFIFCNDDLNTVINKNLELILTTDNPNNGRIQQLPGGCSLYCLVGQVNYENGLISSYGLTEAQARTLGSAWYVGCIYGCNYQP